jgi:hypothetical protein
MGLGSILSSQRLRLYADNFLVNKLIVVNVVLCMYFVRGSRDLHPAQWVEDGSFNSY